MDKSEMSERGFELLLVRLHPDRDKAGEEYIRVCDKLATYFEGRNCSPADEYADVVINRVALKLEEKNQDATAEEIKDIHRYIFGVARFVALEVFTRQPQNVGDPLDDRELSNKLQTLPQIHEDDVRLRYLDQCRQQLPPAEQNLIIEYYQGEKREKIENRKDLAEQYGLTLAALKVKICRIRTKLGDCIKKKLAMASG